MELLPIFFATKFSAHATMIRDWIKNELLRFKSQGSIIGGYGAAAKGMVLLHSVLGDEDHGLSYMDFVLDDAKLKQNTFCPGTVLPVKPTSSLIDYNDPAKPLVIMVFAWNFFDEIVRNIANMLKDARQDITFLVPFPSPRVIRIDFKNPKSKPEVLREFSFLPTPIPNPITHDNKRKKTVMVTYQRNEEFLIPFLLCSMRPCSIRLF